MLDLRSLGLKVGGITCSVWSPELKGMKERHPPKHGNSTRERDEFEFYRAVGGERERNSAWLEK